MVAAQYQLQSIQSTLLNCFKYNRHLGHWCYLIWRGLGVYLVQNSARCQLLFPSLAIFQPFCQRVLRTPRLSQLPSLGPSFLLAWFQVVGAMCFPVNKGAMNLAALLGATGIVSTNVTQTLAMNSEVRQSIWKLAAIESAASQRLLCLKEWVSVCFQLSVALHLVRTGGNVLQ